MSYKRKEIIGDATLYLGSSLEITPTLGRVGAVVTDPPYGINGAVSNQKKRKGLKSKGDYGSHFVDDRKNIINVVVPVIKICIGIAGRVALTPGVKCMWEYPAPTHIGSYQYPASTSICKWGMMLWQPILYYGKDPHPGTLKPDSLKNCTDSERNVDHPCPKPLGSWSWLVGRATKEGETVLDPFMGSGTTGVACANLGRKFIGIELEEKYFDIACKRIDQAQRQGKLFAPPKPKPVEQKLF